MSIISLAASFSSTVDLTLCKVNTILSKNIDRGVENVILFLKLFQNLYLCPWDILFCFVVRVCMCACVFMVQTNFLFQCSNVYFYLFYYPELLREILFRIVFASSFSIHTYLQIKHQLRVVLCFHKHLPEPQMLENIALALSLGNEAATVEEDKLMRSLHLLVRDRAGTEPRSELQSPNRTPSHHNVSPPGTESFIKKKLFPVSLM